MEKQGNFIFSFYILPWGREFLYFIVCLGKTKEYVKGEKQQESARERETGRATRGEREEEEGE